MSVPTRANTLLRRVHPGRLRRTAGAAGCVRESVRFVINELRDRALTREYTLRDSGLRVAIRHPLLDMWVLEEVFRMRAYAFPKPVQLALADLRRAPRIVDLGGHIGCFGLFALGQRPDASVISFEPDPRNVQMLRRCVQANDLGSRWRVLEACAATQDGVVEFISDFHLSGASLSRRAALHEKHSTIAEAFPFMADTALLHPEAQQVASADVMPVLADADLVKIDIEGGEWELLADPRLADMRAVGVVLEYHTGHCDDGDPERVVRDSLQRAGYVVGEPLRAPDAGLVWAWRSPSSG